MSFELVDIEFKPKKREYAGGPRGKRPRTEEQKPWDAAVEKAIETDGVVAVQIAEGAEDTARSHIASAARYFDMSAIEGEPQEGKLDGTVILMWHIRETQKRGPRKTKADHEASAE